MSGDSCDKFIVEKNTNEGESTEGHDSDSSSSDDFGLDKSFVNYRSTVNSCKKHEYKPVQWASRRSSKDELNKTKLQEKDSDKTQPRRGRLTGELTESERRFGIGLTASELLPYTCSLNYAFLKLLLQKPPEKIASELSQKNSEFTAYLAKKHQPQEVELLLSLISKVCACESNVNRLIQILSVVKESHFLQTTVPSFVLSVNLSDARGGVLSDLLMLAKHLLYNIPSSVTVVVRITEVIESILEVCSSDVKNSFVEVVNLQKAAFATFIGTTATFRKVEAPPDNFRVISIFPSSEDLCPNARPFVRTNKAKGKYENTEHYLDVQFRLLKEDFVCPLRESIDEYKRYISIAENNSNFPQHMRVYQNVKVLCPCASSEGFGYRLKFSAIVNLASYSKRLMYGSLLCLSCDNFETFHFATIVKSEPGLLKKGVIDIQFHGENGQEITLASMGKTFNVVESTAFFEAYKHVLNALKNIMPGQLPFENHIVKCEKHIGPPEYLKGSSQFDLRPLLQDDFIIYHERLLPYVNADDKKKILFLSRKKITAAQGRNVLRSLSNEPKILEMMTEDQVSPDCKLSRNMNVLCRQEWPAEEVLGLDTSQCEALRMAFTHKLVIIQGPPGTGKSYVGLKILKALIHNKQCWAYKKASPNKGNVPILVVCHTNHALDQFLREILKFYSSDVVRVGKRSKCALVNTYNLSNYRVKMEGGLECEQRDLKNKMKSTRYKLHSIALQILLAQQYVLHEYTLKKVIQMRHYLGLRYSENVRKRNGKMPGKCYILEWLGIEISKKKNKTNRTNPKDEADQLSYLDTIKSIIDSRRICNDGEDEEDLFDSHLPDDFVVAFSWGNGSNGEERFQHEVHDYIPCDSNTKPLSRSETFNILNVWNISMNERWKLYMHWISCFCKEKDAELEPLKTEYVKQSELYKANQKKMDINILKNASIIGMTTTGAARYRDVLHDIGPKVIVIEEAAEVLEGQTVTLLNKSCQHLILIGDHKQLRPNPTTYKLARNYNLDISFFERMINNGLPFSCLQYQYRMRPEISRLMKLIYPDLRDHEIVRKYDDVRGVKTNLFFISHSEMEVTDEEAMSHSNHHEATLLSGLCKYLIKQSYKQEEITILTAYTGQERLLRETLPSTRYSDVKITTIDNYQGEENEIILLSLVRSNLDKNVGFLKIDNRICVALSRAKQGLYMIGNIDQLASRSELWEKISDLLNEEGQIGPTLSLVCHNHKVKFETDVQTYKDFAGVPEGGCHRECDYRLPCGHVCSLFCHPYDRDHIEYQCKKQCPTVCPRGHKCPKLCFEKCTSCKVPIETIMDKCGHTQFISCHMQQSDHICAEPCSHILSCGHLCKKACGENHTVSCSEMVSVNWLCGHSADVKCFKRGSCPFACSATLPCGHQCEGMCSDCKYKGLHKNCSKVCGKSLECGHHCSALCSSCADGYHSICIQKCERSLVCGHECTLKCKDLCKCTARCMLSCEHKECKRLCAESCGHCEKECSDSECRVLCTSKTGHATSERLYYKKFACGHFCSPSPDWFLVAWCDTCHVPQTVGDEIFLQLQCGHFGSLAVLDKLFNVCGGSMNIIQAYRCPACLSCITINHNYKNQLQQYRCLYEKVKEACEKISLGLIHSHTQTAIKVFSTSYLFKYRLKREPIDQVKYGREPLQRNYKLFANPMWELNTIAFLYLFFQPFKTNVDELLDSELLGGNTAQYPIETFKANNRRKNVLSVCKDLIYRLAIRYFLRGVQKLLLVREDIIDTSSMLRCKIEISLAITRTNKNLSLKQADFCNEVCREVATIFLEHSNMKIQEIIVFLPEYCSQENGVWFYCSSGKLNLWRILKSSFPMMTRSFPNIQPNGVFRPHFQLHLEVLSPLVQYTQVS